VTLRVVRRMRPGRANPEEIPRVDARKTLTAEMPAEVHGGGRSEGPAAFVRNI
jgi:hypothetical protein